jgi:hypothetical protein
MPYCKATLQTITPEQVASVLSSFTKEYFIAGRAAYQLADGSYSLDAGENDIRAFYDKDRAVIQFFCRYERDSLLYEKKIQSFASKHVINHSPE